MKTRKASMLLLVVLVFVPAQNFFAHGNEFDAVCKHLETRYNAKKVKIPFMWLARVAVGIIRPAGVRAFKVTIYEDLQYNEASSATDLNDLMNNAFSSAWSPLLRIRSKKGEQVYVNMRDDGKYIRILLVSLQKNDAVVVRAKFKPEKLMEFIDNPKILGVSIGE
ncbi:MAG: hypothetical protein ACK5NT_12110 [Pyrinomonadaceae bacterium]